MFWLDPQSLGSRITRFLCAVPPVVLALELLLNLDKALIAWTACVALVLLGGEFFTIMLGHRRQHLANGWYRAAYWAGWIVCAGTGALLIGAMVIWAINGPTLGQFPAVSITLLIAVLLLGLVGLFVLVGLLVAGAVAHHSQKIRQHALGLDQRGDVG